MILQLGGMTARFFESIVDGSPDLLYAPDIQETEENGKRCIAFILTIGILTDCLWYVNLNVLTDRSRL